MLEVKGHVSENKLHFKGLVVLTTVLLYYQGVKRDSVFLEITLSFLVCLKELGSIKLKRKLTLIP